MTNFLQNLAGMGGMTDQVIATDLLISAKSGVINYAAAVSEAATPEVREVLRQHLLAAIDTHEKAASYMIKRGWYHVDDFPAQFQVDRKASETVLNMQP